jgi:hypothetical protein
MLLKIFRRVSNLSKHQMGGICQSRICYRKKNLVGRSQMGRLWVIATFRVSPIFLVRKKNGDFRLIHNLSYPTRNSVNDFIDPEFCTVRYSGIDDAIDMINRIGKGGKLAKTDIKSAFRLLRVLKNFRRVSNLSKHQMGGIYQSRICYRKKNLVGRSQMGRLWVIEMHS